MIGGDYVFDGFPETHLASSSLITTTRQHGFDPTVDTPAMRTVMPTISNNALIHPGEVLKEEFLDPLELSAYRLAKDLAVPLTRVMAVVKGRRAVTADTALRLGRYFGTSATFWLNLQTRYDLDLVRLEAGARVDREVSPRSADGGRR